MRYGLDFIVFQMIISCPDTIYLKSHIFHSDYMSVFTNQISMCIHVYFLLFILFCCFVCLFLYQHHTILIVEVPCYILIVGGQCPSHCPRSFVGRRLFEGSFLNPDFLVFVNILLFL